MLEGKVISASFPRQPREEKKERKLKRRVIISTVGEFSLSARAIVARPGREGEERGERGR